MKNSVVIIALVVVGLVVGGGVYGVMASVSTSVTTVTSTATTVSTVTVEPTSSIVSSVSTTSFSTTTTSQNTATTSNNSPITIGAVFDLTGSLNLPDQDYLNGLILWVNQTNAAGGLLGHPVKLIYYDDQSNPTLTVQDYTRLFTVDHVNLCIGMQGTQEAAAMIPLAKEYGYTCSVGATAANLFPNGQQYIYGIIPGYAQNYTLPAFQFWNSLPASSRPTTLGLVYVSDNDFSTTCAAGVRSLAQQYGLKIAVDQGYPTATTDFSSLVSVLKSAGVDFLVGCTYVQDAPVLVKTMHQYDYVPPIQFLTIGPGGATFDNLTGGVAEGVVTQDFWAPSLPATQTWNQQFKSEFGYVPTLFFAATEYSAAQILGDAVQALGSFNQTAIGQYICSHSFNTTDGITYNYTNSPNCYPAPTIFGVQWQNGQQVVVWPPNSAPSGVTWEYPIPNSTLP